MTTKQDSGQTTTRRRSTKKKTEAPEQSSATEASGTAAEATEGVPAQDSTPFYPEEMLKWPLARKLAYIMLDVGNRKPEGKNQHFRYEYFTDAQLSGIFQPRLARFGIAMLPDVLSGETIESKTSKGALTWITNLHVRYTFVDGFTGESLSVTGFGQGDDPGDKGSNKAFTGATKYTLLKTFLIGSEADAERDDATDQRHSAPQQTQRQERRGPIQQSDSKGEVKKGGRQVSATDAQINAISQLVAKTNIGVKGMPNVVKNTLGVELSLPDGDKAGPELRAFLGKLKSEDLGKILQALQTAADRNEQIDKDFAAAEDILRQVDSGEENQDG